MVGSWLTYENGPVKSYEELAYLLEKSLLHSKQKLNMLLYHKRHSRPEGKTLLRECLGVDSVADPRIFYRDIA